MKLQEAETDPGAAREEMRLLTFIYQRLGGLVDLVGFVQRVGGLGQISQTLYGHLIKSGGR